MMETKENIINIIKEDLEMLKIAADTYAFYLSTCEGENRLSHDAFNVEQYTLEVLYNNKYNMDKYKEYIDDDMSSEIVLAVNRVEAAYSSRYSSRPGKWTIQQVMEDYASKKAVKGLPKFEHSIGYIKDYAKKAKNIRDEKRLEKRNKLLCKVFGVISIVAIIAIIYGIGCYLYSIRDIISTVMDYAVAVAISFIVIGIIVFIAKTLVDKVINN